MELTEDQKVAVRNYEAARKQVEKSLTTVNGGKRAETVYAEAYQKLVQVGLAPQLKRKYRP